MSLEATLGRQWQMYQAFANRLEGWTRQELANQFSVSFKTVDRDLKTLRSVFGPFRVETGACGEKRFALEKVTDSSRLSLNRDELLALYVGQKLMEPLRGTYFWESVETARQKIAQALRPTTVQYAERVAPFFYQFESSSPYYDDQTKLAVDAALIAMEDSRVLRITYRSISSKIEKTYEICPYSFLYWRGSVYLIGYSFKDKKRRFWKANRMLTATTLDRRFKRPKNFDVKKLMKNAVVPFVAEEGTIRAKIRFSGVAARLVCEQHIRPIQKIVQEEDGAVVVEMEVENGKPFVQWTLGFGANATVLEPPELRDAILQELKKVSEKYESTSFQTATPPEKKPRTNKKTSKNASDETNKTDGLK